MLKSFAPRHAVRVGAFIIGATKSGTSALFRYLGFHPRCVPSLRKEVSFFNNPANYAKGIDWYHSQFPRPRYLPWRTYQFLDASPNYLDEEETARRLHAYNANARLILLLRDPVTKSFSLWNHWRQTAESTDDRKRQLFERFIRGFDFADRWWALMTADPFPPFRDMVIASMREIDAGRPDNFPNVLSGAIYADQVANYLRYFPRSSLLVVPSERFLRERTAVLSEVTEFLELPSMSWDAAGLPPVHARRYNQSLAVEDEQLLRRYFQPHNERLRLVLGQSFDW